VSIQWTRRGTILFFILFIIAMIWPGMMLGNRTFPLVVGLPFSMAWIGCWVILSFFVLVFLDWAEGRARSGTEGTGAASNATEAEAGTPSAGEEL
jgi:hypothetical protein